MPFALRLQDSLRDRHSQVAREFAAGDSLETVLGRHLLAVEASADTELLTSILLLDESGKRILHGAAPSLPKSYCDAIHGVEIGPNVGSCGTAAFTGRAIYVTDVATDPLWKDYRHLALAHGLRACWSTPICDPAGKLIGTFAVYHLTPRSPTPGEVESIRLITDHVAQAIMWSRSRSASRGHGCANDEMPIQANLRLVGDHDSVALDCAALQPRDPGAANRFQSYAAKLDRYAEMVASRKFAAALKAVADDCRKLGEAVEVRQKGSNDER
jgi:GAF domain-containing protein